MEKYYLDDDVAGRVNAVLRDRLAGGAYSGIADDRVFAQAVTEDTVAASGDVHLCLRYSTAVLPERDDPVIPESGRDLTEAKVAGHGFTNVERLPGNIGLIDVRRFWPLSMSRHAAIGAMHLVADAEVLIIDLRRSEGGEPPASRSSPKVRVPASKICSTSLNSSMLSTPQQLRDTVPNS
jgi:hypothetical protein